VDVFLSSRPRPATAVHAGRNSTSADKQPLKKVLLCAPSNAAIDELATRMSQFSRKSGNLKSKWKVVRIGADKSINLSSREISLEFLIEQKLQSEQGSSNNISNDIAAAQAELESVRRLVQQKKAEEMIVRDNAARLLALQNELKDLNMRRKSLSQHYDTLKDKQKSHSRSLDATRRKIRSAILLEADVICSTLSGAGQDILEPLDFEMIVIDEAAQSIELSSLIPLRHNCRRCVMVGGRSPCFLVGSLRNR
jgi:senataxin